MKWNRITAAAALTLCMGLAGCGHAAQTYTDYVETVMDCTYRGETDGYCRITKASAEDAAAVHQEALTYLSEQLCYQATVERDLLDEETRQGYDALAASLMEKVKYTASDAVKAGDLYQVTVTAEPLDVWDICLGDLEASYKDKYAKAFYEETPGTDDCNELEAAWGAEALKIYQAHADAVTNKEPQAMTTVLYAGADGHYTISQETWRQVDDLVFGIKE